MAELISRVKLCGLEHIQLGLASLLERDEATRASDIDQLMRSGLKLTATMIGFPGEDYTSIASIRRTGGVAPDELWTARRELTIRAAKLTQQLGVKLLTFHAGFVPPSSDPAYAVMVDRISSVANAVAPDGVTLLMETGQESASELLQFLNDLNCRNVGVNYDPANMILYGAGDPLDAIAILNRHIQHVHVKDAVPSDQPRMQWGKEVPFGMGDVVPFEFLDALDKIDYTGPLCIEREAGPDRIAAVRSAIDALKSAE
jgi:sugar phosphate isomerase/epimerase